MDEIFLGEINLPSIYDKESILNEEGLGNPFRSSGTAKVYVYNGEGYENPHFHILFSSNDTIHKKQDKSGRAYQCCPLIFSADYFVHESNKSDILKLVGKEGKELNNFMSKPCKSASKFNIPDKFIYTVDELVDIQKGKMRKNKVITNWIFCKFFYLSFCNRPDIAINAFLNEHVQPDYSLL